MKHTIGLISLMLGIAACTDELIDGGQLRVLVEAEDIIIAGLDPGEGVENIRDGWALRFDQYIVAIGAIEVQLVSDPSVKARADEVHMIDLTKISASGASLWSLTGLEPGRWEFSYAIVGAETSTPHPGVNDDDAGFVDVANLTHLIRGRIEQPSGKSCPPASLATPPANAVAEGSNAAGDPCYPAPVVAFELAVHSPTRFGPCEVDGVPGFGIAAGTETSVAITIHGDHLFFNGFPEGDEGGVIRLAQWLADCDLDLDGKVSEDELKKIAPSDLVELDERYQLGGSPLTPLSNMWTYVEAQLLTQGHFQGEGECASAPFDY